MGFSRSLLFFSAIPTSSIWRALLGYFTSLHPSWSEWLGRITDNPFALAKLLLLSSSVAFLLEILGDLAGSKLLGNCSSWVPLPPVILYLQSQYAMQRTVIQKRNRCSAPRCALGTGLFIDTCFMQVLSWERRKNSATNVSSMECGPLLMICPILQRKSSSETTLMQLVCKFQLSHLSLRATQNYTALCKLVGVLGFWTLSKIERKKLQTAVA